MKEPAKSGLFTLEEEAESAEEKKQRRISWSWSSALSFSPSGSEDEIATPSRERADPFDMPLDVDADMDMDVDIDIEVRTPVDATPYTLFTTPRTPIQPSLAASLSSSSFRPRRPPPLNLSVITDPLAFSTEQTPTNSKHTTHHLLPALPILSPEEYSASTTTSRRLDLDAVFEDLLNTCGESISASSFPMPPPRTPDTPVLQTPTTPPPRHHIQCPGAPGPKARSTPKLKGLGLGMNIGMGMGMGGDHSFLYSLSSDDGSSTSSHSSPSVSTQGSTRSKDKTLPKRSNLPSHWTDNVI